MKKLLFFAVLFTYCSSSAFAQALKIEKNGVILTADSVSQKAYYVENTTKDSVKIYVANHVNAVEELPGGIIAVQTSGKHPTSNFILHSGEKLYLGGIICVHSTGLYIGKEDAEQLLSYPFYAEN